MAKKLAVDPSAWTLPVPRSLAKGVLRDDGVIGSAAATISEDEGSGATLGIGTETVTASETTAVEVVGTDGGTVEDATMTDLATEEVTTTAAAMAAVAGAGTEEATMTAMEEEEEEEATVAMTTVIATEEVEEATVATTGIEATVTRAGERLVDVTAGIATIVAVGVTALVIGMQTEVATVEDTTMTGGTVMIGTEVRTHVAFKFVLFVCVFALLLCAPCMCL